MTVVALPRTDQISAGGRYVRQHHEHDRQPINQSERAVASWLTRFEITWEYESQFYPLSFSDGQVSFGFCPDFWLPGTRRRPELHLEVTTASSLAIKHRKIRRAAELYGIKTILIASPQLNQIERRPRYLKELIEQAARELQVA